MGKVSYQAWARNQACASAYTMLFGGIISILYRTQISADAVLINVTTGLGAYACLIGLIILAVERPLPGIEKMGAAITNFWVRVVFYGIALVPLLSQAPLLASGFFLFVTTCFYAKAAHSGEVWVNPLDTKGGGGEAAPKREEKKKEEKKDDKKDDKKDKRPTITSVPADREYVSQSHLQPQYAGGYEQDAQPNYGGGYGGGYDQQGYDQGYDQQGYDQQGYDQQGYDQQGYDQQGYTS